LNGIDTQDWNPATDTALTKLYSSKNITGKKSVKKHLQKKFELNIDANAPLLGVMNRFAYQKGLVLLPPIIPKLVTEGCQIAILESGEKTLETSFSQLHKQCPAMVGVNVGYNEPLASWQVPICSLCLPVLSLAD
jgi:starch synthase